MAQVVISDSLSPARRAEVEALLAGARRTPETACVQTMSSLANKEAAEDALALASRYAKAGNAAKAERLVAKSKRLFALPAADVGAVEAEIEAAKEKKKDAAAEGSSHAATNAAVPGAGGEKSAEAEGNDDDKSTQKQEGPAPPPSAAATDTSTPPAAWLLMCTAVIVDACVGVGAAAGVHLEGHGKLPSGNLVGRRHSPPVAALAAAAPVVTLLTAFLTVGLCYWVRRRGGRMLDDRVTFPAISELGASGPERRLYQVGFAATGLMVQC